MKKKRKLWLAIFMVATFLLRCDPGYLSKKVFNRSANVKAIVLIDKRLYSLMKSKVDSYLLLASERRQFGILLDCDKELDDYHFTKIRELIKEYYRKYSHMEGVLFIGNIKPPSFYKTRADIINVRYYHPYFEDLDLELTRHYPPGAIDPYCKDTGDYYCQNREVDGHKIPEHDYDEILTFPSSPDLWSSYMPAGYDSLSGYPDFAKLLIPYFNKLISYYSGKYYPQNKMYMVSNDMYGGDYNFWDLYRDVRRVDYYGMNPDTCKQCIASGRKPVECYQRVCLEKYSCYDDFITAFNERPWMGNGWQDSLIFTAQMMRNNYEFVIVNVHGREDYSMLKHFQAKRLKNGGLIIMGGGCSIAGYKLPNSKSYVQSKIYPANNILLSYLYGPSQFRAAFGTAFWRGHSPHYEIIIRNMKQKGYYLGKANLERTGYMYHLSKNRFDLREYQNEFFLGDPFLDVHQLIQ